MTRDEAVQVIVKTPFWERFTEEEREAISMAIESLSIEVVRCKDCMFNHWHTTPNGEKYHICYLNKLSFSEHADFYCAYGERRKDAT